MTTPKRQIAIASCLGLLLTVLSAWLPAMFADLHVFTGSRTEAINGVAFPAYVPGVWPPPGDRYDYAPRAIGYKLSGITTTTRSKRDNPVVGMGLWFHRFGWPVATLQYAEMTIGDGPDMPTPTEALRLLSDFHAHAGWRCGTDFPQWLPLSKPPMGGRNATRTLPLTPVWPGFLIAWTLYTIVAWGILFLPGVLIRERRFRLGSCLNCGYPLGSNTCSECGHIHAARLIPSS